MTSHAIDYLKFKAEKPFFEINHKVERASGNFKWRMETPFGSMLWGHNKSDKYSHVLSGSQWRELVEVYSMNDIAVLSEVAEHGVEFTRIDLCVTTSALHVSDITRVVSKGRGALIDAVSPKSINDARTGNIETLVCGNWDKRGKNGLFRAYRHDLKHDYVEQFSTHRFELEVGSKRANQAAKKVIINNNIGAVLDSYISFPLRGWYEIMNTTKLEVPMRGKTNEETIEEKMASRAKWLIEQCAPALGKLIAHEMIKYDESPTYREFMKVARREFEDELKNID